MCDGGSDAAGDTSSMGRSKEWLGVILASSVYSSYLLAIGILN